MKALFLCSLFLGLPVVYAGYPEDQCDLGAPRSPAYEAFSDNENLIPSTPIQESAYSTFDYFPLKQAVKSFLKHFDERTLVIKGHSVFITCLSHGLPREYKSLTSHLLTPHHLYNEQGEYLFDLYHKGKVEIQLLPRSTQTTYYTADGKIMETEKIYVTKLKDAKKETSEEDEHTEEASSDTETNEAEAEQENEEKNNEPMHYMKVPSLQWSKYQSKFGKQQAEDIDWE